MLLIQRAYAPKPCSRNSNYFIKAQQYHQKFVRQWLGHNSANGCFGCHSFWQIKDPVLSSCKWAAGKSSLLCCIFWLRHSTRVSQIPKCLRSIRGPRDDSSHFLTTHMDPGIACWLVMIPLLGPKSYTCSTQLSYLAQTPAKQATSWWGDTVSAKSSQVLLPPTSPLKRNQSKADIVYCSFALWVSWERCTWE